MEPSIFSDTQSLHKSSKVNNYSQVHITLDRFMPQLSNLNVERRSNHGKYLDHVKNLMPNSREKNSIKQNQPQANHSKLIFTKPTQINLWLVRRSIYSNKSF